MKVNTITMRIPLSKKNNRGLLNTIKITITRSRSMHLLKFIKIKLIRFFLSKKLVNQPDKIVYIYDLLVFELGRCCENIAKYSTRMVFLLRRLS